MKKEIVTAHHVTVKLADVVLLHDISFTVYEQEVLMILGPNGAGKTTLLRTLLGLMPYTGTITWATKHIGYLPPQEALQRKQLPPLTLSEFFSFKKVTPQQVADIIDAVGLEQASLKKEFSTLSTGQFQRALLAWTLADKPKVLVLDEPTAGIDIGGEETIYSLLHQFWKKWKLTMIIVTHDVHVVWEHANNVMCLNKQLIAYGPPKNVLDPERLKEIYGVGVKWYEHKHAL